MSLVTVPERLTNFNRTQNELEHLLIFGVAVAGKTAATTAKAISKLFEGWNVPERSPVDVLAIWLETGDDFVLEKLKWARTGNYNRLLKFFKELVARRPDLKTITVDELKKFHGISYKTAKMTILHSQPNQRHAVIDTHVLKFLRDIVKVDKLPTSSPQSEKLYAALEKILLDWVDRRYQYEKHICLMRPDGSMKDKCIKLKRIDNGWGVDYAAFDLELWNAYKKGNSEV